MKSSIDEKDNCNNSCSPKELHRWKMIIIKVIAVSFALFQIWANSIGMITVMKHLGVSLGAVLSLIFLTFPTKKNQHFMVWYDVFLAIIGMAVGLYIVFRTDTLLLNHLIPNNIDYIVGGIAILIVLEATRRSIGIWLTIIPVVFIIYALFGDLLPGVLSHYGFTLRRLILRLYLVDEGIFGITFKTASTYIFMFIIFGAFLDKSNIGQFFNDLAFAISGWSSGGPGKVAVFASGMLGTISGSAVANVATTGAFTIPLMKKTGFKPEFAGAVEAAASTGGLLAPPIMGSAAFLMAEFLGVNYGVIIKAAILPACLYYIALFFSVHFEAKKLGLSGIPRSQLPELKQIIKRGYLLLPLIIITYAIIIGKTPLYAAMLGIIITVIISQLRKDTRINLERFIMALEDGARSALPVCIACAAAGIIVGVTVMTGLGQVITHNIITLSGNNLLLALTFIMVSVIFITMGLPATAAYIVVVTIAAPALVMMGVPTLAAHMFVFYFASLSNVTPPVALASYTAGGMAGASPSKVAWGALKLTLAGFIVPFIFVLNTQMLMIDVSFPEILIVIMSAILGAVALSVFVIGFFIDKASMFERVLFLIGGITLLNPGYYSDLVGLGIIIIPIFLQIKRKLVQT